MEVQNATERSCGSTDTQQKYSELIKRLEMIREKVNVASEEIDGFQAHNESVLLMYHDCMKNIGHINYLQEVDSKTSEQRELEASLRREVKDKEAKLNGLVPHFDLLQMQLVTHMKENITDLQQLQSQILDEELAKWRHEQQLSGNGVPMQSNLDEIQNLCEPLADLIWSTRQQISKVMNIYRKILPEMRQSRLNEMLDDINNQVTSLLSTLVASTFVVEKQPQQVIRLGVSFISASARLLVGQPLDVHKTPPQVTVMLISEEQAQFLWTSDFASLRSTLPVECRDTLNYSACMEYEPISRKLCVNFCDMQLIKMKSAEKNEKRGIVSVADKKLALLFQSEFNVGQGELTYGVWTLSLPVVVVNNKQVPRGWATITWDNAFRPPGQMPFVVPDKVSWAQLADTLRIKFRSVIGGDLSEDNLRFLAEKLFSILPLDSMELDSDAVISWTQFCKIALPGRHFTFWEWFYMALKLTKIYLSDLWRDGLIIGFIQEKQAAEMLSKSPPGTFLLMFSESKLGCITIAGVEECNEVISLQPFTHSDLKQWSLLSRILHFTQLQFFYPNVPKGDVLSKYYTKPGYVQPVLETTLPPYMSAPSPSSALSPSYAPLPSSEPSPTSALSPLYKPLPTSVPLPSNALLPIYRPSPPYALLPSSTPSAWHVPSPSSVPSPSYAPLPSSAPSRSYTPMPSFTPSPLYAPLPSSALSSSYVPSPGSYLNMPSVDSSNFPAHISFTHMPRND